jgi:hypothetical protein
MRHCKCGWKKPIVSVVSLARAGVDSMPLLVVILCPECGEATGANEHAPDDFTEEERAKVRQFVQRCLSRLGMN